MSKKYTIPIIFGVTGHRDLRDEDIPNLKKSVGAIFKEYQVAYPNTELVLISALAEGADTLVAEVAKELDVTLHLLIPYEEQEYLNSFENKENIKKYKKLKEYSSRFEVNASVNKGAEECYELLGKAIADRSNILIALYDGVDNGKRGGTSAVVKYQREGIKENRFDALDGNALFIIKTPRKSNPNIKTDFTVQKECLGKYVKGDKFNKMLKRVDAINAQTKITDLTDNSLLKTYMDYFDAKAKQNQKWFKRLSKIILVLSAIAFISLEIMHVLHIDSFIFGYGIGLLLAFTLYWLFMKNGKVQDDFVYSRGFTEAIRVQNAWNGAKLNKNVAKYYLKDQHHKFTWIKFILNHLYYQDAKHKPFTPHYDEGNQPIHWIKGQIKYFKNFALPQRHKSFERWEKIEKFFYCAGFATLLLMFAIFLGEYFHLINHEALCKEIAGINIGEFLEKTHLLEEGEHHKHLNWHLLVLLSGVFLLIATFIGEKYIKIEGYEDEIYHFNTMLGNFEEAKRALQTVTKDSNEYKKIVYDLGLKALDENSKWVVLHDSMRAKPSLE